MQLLWLEEKNVRMTDYSRRAIVYHSVAYFISLYGVLTTAWHTCGWFFSSFISEVAFTHTHLHTDCSTYY